MTSSEALARQIPSEIELLERFEPARIGRMCIEYANEHIGRDYEKILRGRQFLVAYIDSDSEYSDIARSTETQVFSETFNLSLTEVVNDYGKYDPISKHAAVIDMQRENPTVAGALRISHDHQPLGYKDVNDLVEDSPDNPWINEIKSQFFDPDEKYDPEVAWQRLGASEGVDLQLDESHDIATHASHKEYAGQNGALSGTSMLFYHACLRYAIATDTKNLLAIFDIPPLENLQQFGKPFDTYSKLNPHPYGGPYDTVPAFCVLERGIKRVRSFNPAVASVFIEGESLDKIALLPNEYLPEKFSNRAVGLA